MKISRRQLLAGGITGVVASTLAGYGIYRMRTGVQPEKPPEESKVLIASASSRAEAIQKLLARFDLSGFKGAQVVLKANYNSADPFPASTHIDTLRSIVEHLKMAGAARLVLGERSGQGDTRRVLEERGVLELSKEDGLETVVLDDLAADEWVEIKPEGLHWARGFKLPKMLVEAEKVVQTCCLKTHRFGGHFTMSLKNSVGFVSRRDAAGFYDYMAELHASPFQRVMIAEINRFYNVDVVIMDAAEGFVSGGPDIGELVKPNLIIASRDRVAIDAVGIALLRSYGSTPEVMKRRIFELEQISRAAELGVGVTSATDIQLVPLDGENEEKIRVVQEILDTQG